MSRSLARFLQTLRRRRCAGNISVSCRRDATASSRLPSLSSRPWRRLVSIRPRSPSADPGRCRSLHALETISPLRERWQVSDSRPAVIYAGALSEEKSARRLLSLEMGLLRSNPMHRLIVVGDGPVGRSWSTDAATRCSPDAWHIMKFLRCWRRPICSSVRAKCARPITRCSKRRHQGFPPW